MLFYVLLWVGGFGLRAKPSNNAPVSLNFALELNTFDL